VMLRWASNHTDRYCIIGNHMTPYWQRRCRHVHYKTHANIIVLPDFD
jgi:hypothetical protein